MSLMGGSRNPNSRGSRSAPQPLGRLDPCPSRLPHSTPLFIKSEEMEEGNNKKKRKTQQTRNPKGKQLEIETKRVGP